MQMKLLRRTMISVLTTLVQHLDKSIEMACFKVLDVKLMISCMKDNSKTIFIMAGVVISAIWEHTQGTTRMDLEMVRAGLFRSMEKQSKGFG